MLNSAIAKGDTRFFQPEMKWNPKDHIKLRHRDNHSPCEQWSLRWKVREPKSGEKSSTLLTVVVSDPSTARIPNLWTRPTHQYSKRSTIGKTHVVVVPRSLAIPIIRCSSRYQTIACCHCGVLMWWCAHTFGKIAWSREKGRYNLRQHDAIAEAVPAGRFSERFKVVVH